jgi:hypothetical protein
MIGMTQEYLTLSSLIRQSDHCRLIYLRWVSLGPVLELGTTRTPGHTLDLACGKDAALQVGGPKQRDREQKSDDEVDFC